MRQLRESKPNAAAAIHLDTMQEVVLAFNSRLIIKQSKEKREKETELNKRPISRPHSRRQFKTSMELLITMNFIQTLEMKVQKVKKMMIRH